MSAPTTGFVRHDTSIPGLLTFDIGRVEDSRGWFQEKFHAEKLAQAGLPREFSVVQTSISYNFRGATRGFHAEPWNKYVSLVDGHACAFYVDLRKGNSFGTVVEVELRPDVAVFVPAGVGNSYQCLTDLHYIYSVDQHWTPDAYERYTFVNLADPDIAAAWPIPLSEALLSEKDIAHPMLRDTRPIA